MPDAAHTRDPVGHAVLAVPVPELEGFVRGRTAFYDASFLSPDPAFVHAHITLLAPFLPAPTPAELALVADIAATTPPFEVVLAEVAAFPDGLIHLRPDPAAPFEELTRRLAEAFPQCPPYGGRFDPVVPHLTLDRRSEELGVDVDSVAAAVAGLLPVRLRVDRVDLQWWANHDCHVRETWKLGSAA